MLTLHTKIDHADKIDDEIVLSFDMREKSRLHTRLASGEEVAIIMVRGTVLRNGDLLKGDHGCVVRILAAKEDTYRIECATPRDLLRCAFYLGNRHIQTQVGSIGDMSFLRIRKDSYLKEMLEDLGATVIEEHAAFEPETDADDDGHHDRGDAHHHHPLAPIPVRQKIHRPFEK